MTVKISTIGNTSYVAQKKVSYDKNPVYNMKPMLKIMTVMRLVIVRAVIGNDASPPRIALDAMRVLILIVLRRYSL